VRVSELLRRESWIWRLINTKEIETRNGFKIKQPVLSNDGIIIEFNKRRVFLDESALKTLLDIGKIELKDGLKFDNERMWQGFSF